MKKFTKRLVLVAALALSSVSFAEENTTSTCPSQYTGSAQSGRADTATGAASGTDHTAAPAVPTQPQPAQPGQTTTQPGH